MLLLGREPSLHELDLSICSIIQIRFQEMKVRWRLRGGCFRSQKVDPEKCNESRFIPPEKFSNEDLLKLFDPTRVFRQFGIISSQLEDDIYTAKSKNYQATSQFKAQGIDSKGNAKAREEKDDDPWAVDRNEFSHLLHIIDERDDTFNFDFSGSDTSGITNEFIIANLVFKNYGRPKAAAKSNYKRRLEDKIDLLLKQLNPVENEAGKALNRRASMRRRATMRADADL